MGFNLAARGPGIQAFSLLTARYLNDLASRCIAGRKTSLGGK
jgi:hypothetical protein